MRLCCTLDLHDDPALIAEYERWHRPENIWPEIPASIRAAGVHDMQIYRAGNRLFMVMEVTDDFSAARKAQADAANPRVVAWEHLMQRFQQTVPFAAPGQWWMPMQRIFALGDTAPPADPPGKE